MHKKGACWAEFVPEICSLFRDSGVNSCCNFNGLRHHPRLAEGQRTFPWVKGLLWAEFLSPKICNDSSQFRDVNSWRNFNGLRLDRDHQGYDVPDRFQSAPTGLLGTNCLLPVRQDPPKKGLEQSSAEINVSLSGESDR